VFDVNREHPEYGVHKFAWRQYQDMYTGGEEFKANAERYLVRRNKEPFDVYRERLLRVFYENYVGSIIDWYTATLFRREPLLTFDGPDERGKKFFGKFIEDCDLRGSNFNEFFRRRFVDALIYGTSYILVDFPKWMPAANRAEEDAKGYSRAYLTGFCPEELINWSVDEHGNYEWVVLKTSGIRKAAVEDHDWSKVTRWAYYDREEYRFYERVEQIGKASEVILTASGRHGLAKQNRVPLFDLKVTEGLWLMNRAGSLQLEHFNKSNSLSWALTMGLYTMPVIYSDKDWQQIMGESYYVQLGPNDKFGWTEPQGRVFEIAADNLSRLQEEIYRVCYLTQAGGTLSAANTQSGLSKQRDFAITHEVLRAYGDAVKDSMKRVLRGISAAREDNLSVGVSGMDEFDIGDFATELEDAQHLLGLGINSPTLQKQVFKKLALKYLCDVRQDIKDQIAREIDSQD